jgi:hypothetical protein
MLIDARLHNAGGITPSDTERCPHCDAVVPAIKPVPFEYCPYCETNLDSEFAAEHESRNPVALLFESLIWDPLSGNPALARAHIRRF